VDLAACCGHAVAIVGSRAATAYGNHVASGIAVGLADGGWTVVSGAAYGIDAAAHSGALAADGITVAVLACGVDRPYPRAHAGLLQQIATYGLIVSEAPPGRQPSRDAFLARNRIIAALAGGVVVIEAGRRSGTMSTVAHADALGRPVMAVPGPVTSAVSAGCHQLIREQAALCVTSASDVLAHLRL
jgi:DNA processing protein